MKMERLSQNKIRIFLTFDDLQERGIQKDDMWKELEKVHELFSDMMEQAYNELGFDASGPLVVEIFKLPAQGMVVIVTKSLYPSDSKHSEDDYDEEADESYEFEMTLEPSDTMTYAFRDFEDVLNVAKMLKLYELTAAALYKYESYWILQIDANDLDDHQCQNIIAILSEFGDAASVTQAVLQEYGKRVIETDAMTVLCTYFL